MEAIGFIGCELARVNDERRATAKATADAEAAIRFATVRGPTRRQMWAAFGWGCVEGVAIGIPIMLLLRWVSGWM